jgi:hypothetical protein
MVDNEDVPTKNDPVSKTTMTLVMLHPSGLDPMKMNPHSLAAHLTGDFVSTMAEGSSVEIADDRVDDEIEALGGAPGFFKRQDSVLVGGDGR